MTSPPRPSHYTRPTQTSLHTTSRVIARGTNLWRRTQRSTRRTIQALQEGVSAQGWSVLIVFFLVGTVGFIVGWNEFVVAAVFAGVLIITALPFLVGARTHTVQVELDHNRIVVGESAALSVTVTNTGRAVSLPGSIDIPVGEGMFECHTPVLLTGAEYQEEFHIPGTKRGVLEVGPARSVRKDPLDLFRRERVWQDTFSLMIHPQTVRIPSMTSGFVRDLEGQASAKLVTDDLSFHAIREYQPGDARKQVHWKSTAKTGTLMVRQYEESRRSNVAIMLATNQNEFRDPDEFELAVSVAASVGVRGLIDGRTVNCVVADAHPMLSSKFGQRATVLAGATPQIYLDGLTRVETQERGLPFEQLARLTALDASSASIVFLVGGSGLTVQQMRRASLMFPPEVGLVVVRCDTHAEPDMWTVANIPILSVALLDDLPHLLIKGQYA